MLQTIIVPTAMDSSISKSQGFIYRYQNKSEDLVDFGVRQTSKNSRFNDSLAGL